MKHILLVDFGPELYSALQHFGIAESQASSWGPESRNTEAVRELLTSSPFVDPQGQILEFLVQSVESADSLEAYYTNFIRAAFVGAAQKLPELRVSLDVLAINLMPFHLSTTLVDKIAKGLAALSASEPLARDIPVVFLVRNLDWFTKSVIFKSVAGSGSPPTRYTIIDVRGLKIDYENGRPTEVFQLSRSLFQNALRFRDDGFYRALIYGTNSFIGHFELKDSHVRTHYDLSEFVRRDNVSEHVFSLLANLINGFERVTILGVGMEQSVIMRLGFLMQSMLPDRICSFEYLTEANLRENKVLWLQRSDCVVVLTDIVNTGNTLEAVVAPLSQNNPKGVTVRMFSMIRMSNSPQSIGGVPLNAAITIKREFYPRDEEKCPLCQLHQPIKRVLRTEDFYHVAKEQLTPFDFWEIVSDCRALLRLCTDPQGRKFSYRVDTRTIIRRYGRWLKNVIRYKYDSVWPRFRPDVICTVEEDAGLAFARAVAESLDVRKVVSISRNDLRRVTPSGVPLTNPLSAMPRRVLVVDDGMNYGSTMETLIDFCRAAKINPMGALVFDSRLKPKEVERLQSKMGGHSIIALYTWPSSPVATGNE